MNAAREQPVEIDIEERPAPAALLRCQWVGAGVDVDGTRQLVLDIRQEAGDLVGDPDPLWGIAADTRYDRDPRPRPAAIPPPEDRHLVP